VEPLGYRPPGKLYLLAHYSSSSLDFLDATHLLLTFRRPRLLLRAEDSSGLDQVIQADVLELPTGKVVAQDQWLLHDRGRYLWRLMGNKILLRIGSDLFETDGNLHLKSLYESPSELENVETSPDGRLLVLESELEKHTPEEHARLAKHAAAVGNQPPAEDVQIRMIRVDQPKLMLSARADAAGDVPANTDGFFSQEQSKDGVWNVRFHPYEKSEPAGGDMVAEIDSACEPSEKALNEQSVLVLSCPHGRDDRFVAAYSLNRHKLWDGRWQSNFTWPAFRMAQDGDSVAISWLAVNHPVSARDPINDEDVQNQVLSVLDSRTGSLRMALLLRPIVSAGGNFALSADGNRLAVLNHGAVEVYDLPTPAPSPNERAAK
jgi:WD40 repeat protein